MKRSILYLIYVIFLFTTIANAQIWKKVKRAAQRGVERTVENRTEKDSQEATNDVYDIISGKKKKNKNKGKKSSRSNDESDDLEDNSDLEEDIELDESGSNEVGFKRGERVIFSDSFDRDAIGDFPAKWNTTLGGEVKRLKGYDEKWLKVPGGSKVFMELSKPLPKNFTVEMDLIMPKNIEYRIAGIAFMSKAEHNLNYTLSPDEKNGVGLFLYGHRNKNKYTYGNRSLSLRWTDLGEKFPLNKRIKLAFEVNNHERFRVYADGNKIVDLPRIFKPEFANAIIIQAVTHGSEATKSSYFYVSNVVIAETGVDERSQVSKELLENGTFTTSDILFASGSANIQSSSSGILDKIGEAMSSAPSAQFLIIGHTDSDGDATSNQKLSQERAEAVKTYLTQNFKVKASQLMCVGKGDSAPVDSNNTSEGKAKNRRVEFKKL